MIAERFEEQIATYSDELVENLVANLAPVARSRSKASPRNRLEKWLGDDKIVDRCVAELAPASRQVLALLSRTPKLALRWDHAIRLMTAAGIESPYLATQALLHLGLLVLERPGMEQLLARFEIPSTLPLDALPRVRLAAPLVGRAFDSSPIPRPAGAPLTEPTARWRVSDAWEFPLRLATLWLRASRVPIKRTQQQQLFKRDWERIVEDPLIGGPFLDQPLPIEQVGLLVYAMAMEQGWLPRSDDEQSPSGLLVDLWPADRAALDEQLAAAYIAVDSWNELGSLTPVGFIHTELPSARLFLLHALATLEADEAATVEVLADLLVQAHPPWNASGEVLGPMRQEVERRQLAREWTRRTLLGPAYQLGLVEVQASEMGSKELSAATGSPSLAASPAHETRVRLAPLGRWLLGQAIERSPVLGYASTLLVQPNHQLIVYRQGLSVPLLGNLMRFAEPKNLGAALTFDLTSETVYHGLETGLSADAMLDLLREAAGREPPSGVADSIRTWSGKRDRLTIYPNAAIFEFADAKDLEEAQQRGLEGVPVTDKHLLVVGDAASHMKHLRITASRDYRFPAEQSIRVGPDGITLEVDLSRSDLMLDSELARLSEPLVTDDRSTTTRRFRITPESLSRAFERGHDRQLLETWFAQRTGGPIPPSVELLVRAVTSGLAIPAAQRVVLQLDDPQVADGLMQHPRTAPLVGARLGPKSLTVSAENLEPLQEALKEMGISIELDPRNVPSQASGYGS